MDQSHSQAQALGELRTDRLRLLRLEESHLPAVVAISVDPRANEHRPGGAPTVAEAESIVRGFIADWERDGIGYWAVEYDSRVVGICGVKCTVVLGRDCWNLYYRFSPAVWGLGLASESAREAVRVAREQNPERPVLARTRADNASAIKLALAVGMTRDPRLDADGFITYSI